MALREVWRQVWSNNPQEQLNKEVRPEILAACRKAAEKKEGTETEITSDTELAIEAISA